jgi:hypothetical protein
MTLPSWPVMQSMLGDLPQAAAVVPGSGGGRPELPALRSGCAPLSAPRQPGRQHAHSVEGMSDKIMGVPEATAILTAMHEERRLGPAVVARRP